MTVRSYAQFHETRCSLHCMVHRAIRGKVCDFYWPILYMQNDCGALEMFACVLVIYTAYIVSLQWHKH